MEKVKRDERQTQVLRELVLRLTDGITPTELKEELNLSSETYAAIMLSRLKRQGIVFKKKAPEGCRYCISSKGERKLAWLEAKSELANEGR